MERTKLGILIISLALSLGACGGNGDETPTATSGGENIGAAVGSLFGSEEQASLTIKRSIPYRLVTLMVREAVAQETGPQTGPMSACDAIGNEEGIAMSRSVEAGTYGIEGSEGNFVTLAAADGCDQDGDYMSWTVSSHSMTCTDGSGTSTTVTMTDSSGVFAETSAGSDIYGTFNVSAGDDGATGVACHLVISESTFTTAVCVDTAGNSVSQDADTSCTDS